MRAIRLVVEYDGTEFHGWQIQPEARTVQGEIETAIRQMTGQHSTVRGASRTDAGVHALGQVASFKTESSIPAGQFAPGLTGLTGRDVAIVAAEETTREFSARHDAKGKTYRYQIWNRPQPSPLHRRACWHLRQPLDLGAMRRGAEQLLGSHDFAAFRASSCEQKSTVREMRHIAVERSDEGLVELTFTATAFLQHMVRILVGTLTHVGQGKLSPDDVQRIRDSLDRTRAGPTAPAQGLCLVEVHY